MFSLEPFLESRYVVLKIRGPVAVHFISTLATSERTWHPLWLESIPTLPDFLLKLLFADHISSVSFCHLSSLPQLSVREKCSLRPSQDGSYSTSILKNALRKRATVGNRRLRSRPNCCCKGDVTRSI